ncbi:uncharacterized protein PFLUO_LOCUS1532 [Penicillium psychrofluorescens]|uniref:uncharacterized protein n=1 Tax=Penicillium psychrofluorescens TaxID=3158075 RepID=UPI003CCCF238
MVSNLLQPTYALPLTAGLAVLLLGHLSTRGSPPQLIPSPLKTVLPSLTDSDKAGLPYPPDALPGARDVTSPYGTFRCYEWGSTNGRFVLLVHGISTPSLALYPLAQRLVNEHGCRVLLIDLWGRGYSDAPGDLPYDARLYTSQILLALTSSPVSWTGAGGPADGFDIMGYSLGGGIASNFAANFPHMIRSVTLLTPAGLIRPERRGWAMRLMYSSPFFPEALLKWFVKRSLGGGKATTGTNYQAQNSKSGISFNILNAPSEELPKENAPDEGPLIETYPHVSVAGAVNWQLMTHPGFISSFISSIRHAPNIAQQEMWRHIPTAGQKPKVLILAGETDPIILADDLREDAIAVLGEENVRFEVLSCGHELPVTCSEQASAIIGQFWSLEL